MNILALLLQFLSRRQSPAVTRRFFVTAFACLLLVGGVLYNNRSSYLLAQTGNPSVVVNGGGNVTAYPGAPDSNISFSASVTGAPVQGAECTLTGGGGPPSPWSGPTWSWDSTPTVVKTSTEGNAASLDVTLTPSSGSSSVSVNVDYANAETGTYKVTVDVTVSYSSNCGNKAASGSKDFYITVGGGKVWTTDTGISVSAISPAPAVTGDPIYVANGGTLQVGVSASDYDRWTLSSNTSTDADTLTYAWSGGGTFSSTTSASPTWTPPALAVGETSVDYTLTCVVDDTPKTIPGGESGNRNDTSVTVTRLVRVARKTWSADTAISVTPVSPGQQGLYVIVESGSNQSFSVTVSDLDKWTLGDTTGTDSDTLTYQWLSNAGGTFNSTTSASTTWTPPALAAGVNSADFIITCRVDDTPKAIGSGESGSRGDALVPVNRLVRVVRKVWTADTGISGGNLTTGTTMLVARNATANVAVDTATDNDKWTKPTIPASSGTAADVVSYTWSASGGKFVGPNDGNGNPTLVDTITGKTAQWVAPTLPGHYTVTCTIDDLPTAADDPNTTQVEIGTRDDSPVTRSSAVTVYSLSLSFVETEVAAGNINNDLHKATYEITASDGTNPVPNVPVPVPTVTAGGLGPSASVTASCVKVDELTGTNGKATGTFRSGHRTQATTIGIVSAGASASINQVWRNNSNPWTFDPYYDYDVAAEVQYQMSYSRGVVSGHSMTMENTSISGWEWDPYAGELDEYGLPYGDYLPIQTFSPDDEDLSGWLAYNALSSWSNVAEETPGTYSADETIVWDEDFIVSSVDFDAVDNSAFGALGDID